MSFPIIALAAAGVAVLDCEHKTPKAVETGYPYIAIPDIQNGRVQLSRVRRISETDLLEWTRRTQPEPGDILVTRRGRVGDTAPIPADPRCAIGQNIVLLRASGSVLDQTYLRWAVRSPQWWSEVDRLRNVGAIFSSLNVRDISRIRVPLPPLPEQRAIAEVLNALDDKIAANTELVSRVDEVARMVFASAQRDPVAMPLSETARFVNGKAFTKDASGTGRVVIRIAELNSGIGSSTVYSDAEVEDDFVAHPGDILFAWSGSLTLHRWFRAEGIVNQHIFKVSPSGYPSWLVYQLIRERLDYFKSVAADKATTMGHIQRRHLDELVHVPSDSAIASVDTLMTTFWNRSLLAEQESETLAAMRDALLPQLMSGNVRVRDAEKLVEEVA